MAAYTRAHIAATTSPEFRWREAHRVLRSSNRRLLAACSPARNSAFPVPPFWCATVLPGVRGSAPLRRARIRRSSRPQTQEGDMSAGPQAGPSKNRGRRILPIRTSGILAAAAVVGASLAISTVSLAASSGKAAAGTPAVNGLTPALLTANPNSFNPQRLTSSQALTCDQNHGYTAEQNAFDSGKMDLFVQNTQTATCSGQPVLFGAPGLVMDYYDGNTVTGLWNYAQNYAMSDNNYDTVFGPSTPGALNLISGNSGGAYAVDPTTGATVPDPGAVSALNSQGLGTIYGDPDPAYDSCSNASHTRTNPVAVVTGQNIGDML